MNHRSDKPTKIPDSFLRQGNSCFDPTSHLTPPRTIRCWDCNETMRGDMGLQVMRTLADSQVQLAVIVHLACAEQV